LLIFGFRQKLLPFGGNFRLIAANRRLIFAGAFGLGGETSVPFRIASILSQLLGIKAELSYTIGYCRVSSHDQKEDLLRQMTTLTYCKGLPTPLDELNPTGYTELECFLAAFSQVFYRSTTETVNHLLNQQTKFNKSSWNTYLQKTYGISKRHALGVIALSIGKVDSASRCRTNHIKHLEPTFRTLNCHNRKLWK
jgi:hypothetical protein